MIESPRSLSGQLTLWYTISYGAVLLVAFATLYFAIDFILDIRIDEDLQEDVEELQQLLEEQGPTRLLEDIQRESDTGDNSLFFIVLTDNEGNQLTSSNLTHWPNIADALPIKAPTPETDTENLTTLHLSYLDFPARAIAAQLDDTHRIWVGESTEEKHEILQLIKIVLAITTLVVLPLIAIIGRLVTQNRIKGIEDVINIAADINNGALNKRVTQRVGCEEVERLSSTFNSMLDRIYTLITEMREITDNVAHDLRSPLARIRAVAETALANPNSDTEHIHTASCTIEECDRLLELINTTLDIAELEARTAKLNKVPLDVSVIVEDVCELFTPLAEMKNILLQTENNITKCWVNSDHNSLQRTIANMIDNAIKYTPPGGSVTVRINCSPNHTEIEINDTGIGISELDTEKVFDRFYRCDQSRSQQGCGLGLNYVKAFAQAHSGDISLFSRVGKGTRITLTLPTTRVESLQDMA